MQVGYAITKMPEGFHLHKGVKRVYDQRRQMVESGEGVDWGMAEALAFGTLLSEGDVPPINRSCLGVQLLGAELANNILTALQGVALLCVSTS